MRLFICWKEHRAVPPPAQILVLSTARGVFKHLDSSAWRAKQMFAAEVTRLETESRDKHVPLLASRLSHEYPEIPELCLQFSPHKFSASGGPSRFLVTPHVCHGW